MFRGVVLWPTNSVTFPVCHMCHLSMQMVGELVRAEQKAEELRRHLPTLLCDSSCDDCSSLTQRVTSTIEACKEVSSTSKNTCTPIYLLTLLV